MTLAEGDRWIVDQLVGFVTTWTGFSTDAVLPESIRRALRLHLEQSGNGQEVLAQAAAGDPRLKHLLQQAVSVGETFFFRHPEHFAFLTGQVLELRRSLGLPFFRAWSAGCATGEETYSIAACLLSTLQKAHKIPFEVLGTDLLERNVASARQGIYKPWSIRPSGPILYPTFRHLGDGRVEVNDEVKEHVTFQSRNLLDPPPIEHGLYDLVFCRNVLVYFSRDAMDKVYANLVSALAPEGVLILATMDVQRAVIPGTVRLSTPEMQIFARADGPWAQRMREADLGRAQPRPITKPPASSAVAKPVPVTLPKQLSEPPAVVVARKRSKLPVAKVRAKSIVPPAAVGSASAESIAQHVRALGCIERGQRRDAEHLLSDLCKKVPDYLPALLERALLHIRYGEKNAATGLMKQVLERAKKLPSDQTITGPEALPAGFYATSAEAYLRRQA